LVYQTDPLDWRKRQAAIGKIKVIQIARVLLVDDFKPWRQFVVSLLEEKPEWQIVGETSDGLDAVQKAKELGPDLILLDIGLPKLNGIEAGRQIRKLTPESRIIFVTQESSADVVTETLSFGAQGYVLKMRAGGDLLIAMEAVLGGKQFVSCGLLTGKPS
jgi:DNA-binding NarL/FixJ family response regulator